MAAGLQEGEHQRVEFVAHRQAGERDDRVLARRADGERRLARVLAVADERDPVGERGDLLQELAASRRDASLSSSEATSSIGRWMRSK